MQEVLFSDLGRMEYQAAWDRQEQLFRNNLEIKSVLRNMEAAGDVLPAAAEAETVHHLMLVEHPPVYTLGKSGTMEHLRITEQ